MPDSASGFSAATLPTAAPEGAAAPEGMIIYAVGDIHGRRDLLDGAIRELCRAARAAAERQARVVAVFLGDYIDRGPDSRGVIARLIQLRDRGICETVFLRGNHEQVLLDVVDGVDASRRWLEYGGLETLASYCAPDLPPEQGRQEGKLSRLAGALIPPAHIEFLRATRLTAKYGAYLFVHAGLRPDRLVEEQSPADLLWYRYYDDKTPVHSEVVVHGHSPNRVPILGRHRIGIDTEAYESGALTLLRLEGTRREFLKVELSAAEPYTVVGPWRSTASSYEGAPPAPPAKVGRQSSRTTAGSRGHLRRPVVALAGAMLLLFGAAAGLSILWHGDSGASTSRATAQAGSSRPATPNPAPRAPDAP